MYNIPDCLSDEILSCCDEIPVTVCSYRQSSAIYIAISRWSSILSDLRHIVVYMLYIEKYCMKFIDVVVLMTRLMVSLSLTLYCNQNWTCNSSRWQPLLLVTSDLIQFRRLKYKLFCQIKVDKNVNPKVLSSNYEHFLRTRVMFLIWGLKMEKYIEIYRKIYRWCCFDGWKWKNISLYLFWCQNFD